MSLGMMGASSSADRETRILRLKGYLNTVTTDEYNSLTALKQAGVYSFKTLSSYLKTIKSNYWDTLSERGKENFKIAERESELIAKANAKAKRHKR